MPKFTFKCEHENYTTGEVEVTNTIEFKAESINEVLDNFQMFLKGSGYNFEGTLDIVNDDDSELANDYSEDLDELLSESTSWPFPANGRPA